MNRTKLALLSALLVVGFSAPAAAAWNSHGESEPNSNYDIDAYMWDVLPQDTGVANPVYFNAFAQHYIADANPNNGVTGSRVSPTPTLYWNAVFGVWKDCNGDGYIGSAESAAQEYRAELLLSSAVCPSGSEHNDGQWVYELRVIGKVDPCEFASEERRNDANDDCTGFGEFNERKGVIYMDGDVRMWGDQGHPGEVLGGSSCPIRPIPRGSFSNTGMMLRFADCFVGWRVATTLGFSDPTNPQDEDSPLVMNLPVSLFGNHYSYWGDGRTGQLEQDSGKPTATVWDCSNGGVSPGVASDPTDASAFDAADYAIDGLTVINGPVQTVASTYNTAVRPVLYETTDDNSFKENLVLEPYDCNADTRTELGAAYYGENIYGQNEDGIGLLEGNNNPGSTSAGKVEVDFIYTFFDGGFNPEAAEDRPVIDTLGPGTPPDGGIARLHQLFGPGWSAQTVYVSTPQTINRATLEPSSRSYWTHYASVDRGDLSAAGASAPSAADGIYGADNCGAARSGIVNGWNCAPAAWYPNGHSTMAEGGIQDATIGDLYQFRDVDCFDGTLVAGLPARASLTDVSPRGICENSAPLL